MTNNYLEFTKYQRTVDIKKLHFIISSIGSHFDATQLNGLDVGCGAGNVTIPLASCGYKITGIDISPDKIAEANQGNTRFENLNFSVGDSENLDFPTEYFDFIVCSENLEHLRNPEKAIESFQNLLKPEGLLIITIPNGFGPYSIVFDHIRNVFAALRIFGISKTEHLQSFSVKKIYRLLNAYEFNIVHLSHSDFISSLPVLNTSKAFSHFDCKLADRLPHFMVSGYFMLGKKNLMM